MPAHLRTLLGLAAAAMLALTLAACGALIAKSADAKANAPLKQSALQRLAAIGSAPGQAMLVRIYKETSELEVWMQTKSGDYKLFKTYGICAWSGALGPKIKEGDRQAPEGFYTITPGLMNPNSSYYLSFNTGFPNKYDRSYGRTGTNLMIHGSCSSAGCYAMTDEQIAELYALARESFKGGNAGFQLEMFPFRMTPTNLARHASDPNMAFWRNIKEGYDILELTGRPANWDVCGRRYVFNVMATSGQPLDAVGSCPPLDEDAALVAKLKAKQASDEAQIAVEVAALTVQAEKDAAAADALAKQQAAIKSRGDAIGSFVGGLFGAPAQTAPTDLSIVAPVPRPPIKRT